MNGDEIDDFGFEDKGVPEEAFHIEADLYDSGELSNLLVIPCNDTYIVTGNNEHLCTLIKTCDEPECWKQQDGALDDEVIEKIGAAISGYINFS